MSGMSGPNLRMRGVTKSFGGVRALDGVDLTVPAGQVHALLGHNGAGKSTLIKCLGGALVPDAGTIEVGGTRYPRLSPRASIAAGVAIIFQTLSVVDSLTVTENIFLGQEWTRYGRVDRRAQEEVAAGLLGRVAASCSPRDRVGELPMAQRQLVEIAKALSRSASVLVLDEPTAALSGAESDALAERVEDLRAQDLAIVYVTHLLGEVERLADAVTVLRDGRVTHHSVGAGQSRRTLVRAIAPEGRAAVSPRGSTEGRGHRQPVVRPPHQEQSAPARRLTATDLSGPGFGPLDISVAEGEIVGLYGLVGSGRTRILETLFGRRPASSGTVQVGDDHVTPTRPAEALAAGIALVPADRRAQGLFPLLGAQDNALLPTVRSLARRGVRALRTEQRIFTALSDAVGLHPARPRLPASAFSGGNQQKLLLGRWINDARRVDVLLLDEPTQGVDVGARHEIYQVVSALAGRRGAAVLFASSDPEEIVTLAHRCLIVCAGRIVGELSGARLTEAALLSAVHDASPARPHSARSGATAPTALAPSDPEPSDAAPTDPPPTAITPSDPAPTDPAPSDPATSDPAPTAITPSNPAPTDPAPSDPATSDPAPSDPAPSDPAPTAITPSDPAPTDPAPSDPAPSDPAPTAITPSDPAPTDPAPSDPAPSDPAPTDPAPSEGAA